MNSWLLFLLGTIQWLAFALVHPILVDIDLVLGLHSPIGPEAPPDGDNLRSALIANTWDFGWGARPPPTARFPDSACGCLRRRVSSRSSIS